MAEHLLDVNGGTLPDQIYSRMVEAILRGDYVDSKKLPTESELASQFGVSRPTVREALSRLRSDGIIESRRGSGSHVVRAPGTPASSMPPIRNYSDIERYYAYRTCVDITRANSRSFFLSSQFLPAPKRRAIRALYAFWTM